MSGEAIDLLKEKEMFSHLNKQELSVLEPFLFERTLKKGQYLFWQGDPRLRIYYLLDGYITLEKSNRQGSLQYNQYIKKDTLFPYNGLFSDSKEYSHSAIAETDVHVLYLSTDVFEGFVAKQNRLLQSLIKEYGKILDGQERRIQNVIIPNAQERVLNSISYLMMDLGVEYPDYVRIDLPITTAKLSAISGTSRETASMVINKLKREKKLTIKGKMIHIHEPQYFKKIVI
ncbi:Crp/Fnr family transcriptional regulator [Pradoshia sp.]